MKTEIPMPCGHTEFCKNYCGQDRFRVDYFCPECQIGIRNDDRNYYKLERLGGFFSSSCFCNTDIKVNEKWRKWCKQMDAFTHPYNYLKNSGKF